MKIASISVFISKDSAISKKMRIISSSINQQMLIQKIQKKIFKRSIRKKTFNDYDINV